MLIQSSVLLIWLQLLYLTTEVVQSRSNQVPFPPKNYKEDDLLLNIPNRPRNPDGECPPCFNCMLPMFECKQFSECNSYTGRCDCIEGFAGDDCALPLCGSLEKGNNERPIRSCLLYTSRCV